MLGWNFVHFNWNSIFLFDVLPCSKFYDIILMAWTYRIKGNRRISWWIFSFVSFIFKEWLYNNFSHNISFHLRSHIPHTFSNSMVAMDGIHNWNMGFHFKAKMNPLSSLFIQIIFALPFSYTQFICFFGFWFLIQFNWY